MPIIDIPNGNSAKQILLEGEVVTFLLYFTENERTSNNRFQPKACLTKSLFIICATTFLWRDSPQSPLERRSKPIHVPGCNCNTPVCFLKCYLYPNLLFNFKGVGGIF